MKAVADFDLRLFRIFKTVVDCGGLSASQSILDMNLSSISTHISSLEKRVGFVVCQRGRSGFRLTPGGQDLYASITELLEAIEQFRGNVSVVKEKLTGELSIGIIDGLISDRRFKISNSVSAVKSKSSSLFVRLEIMPPNQLEQKLEEGFIDIGVGTFAFQSKSIIFEKLYDEEMGLYSTKDHVLAETAKQEEILLRPGASFDCVSRGYLRESRQPKHLDALRTAAVVHSMEAAAMLILSGHYIGFLPEHFASRWEDTGQMVRILPSLTNYKVPLGILRRREYKTSPAAKIFMDVLADG